jgi:hypothetical protein
MTEVQLNPKYQAMLEPLRHYCGEISGTRVLELGSDHRGEMLRALRERMAVADAVGVNPVVGTSVVSAAEILTSYATSASHSPSQGLNRKRAAQMARYLQGCRELDDAEFWRRAFAVFTKALDASRGQSLERSIPELREMITAFA